MSYKCCKCEASFFDVALLIKHIKLKHKYDNQDHYICKQGACTRAFQNINVFRAHLLKKHPKSNNNFEIQVVPNVISTSAQLIHSIPTASKIIKYAENVTTENVLTPDSSVTAAEHHRCLQNSGLKYVLHFYITSSITRQNVQDIVETTTEFIQDSVLFNLKTKVMAILDKPQITEKDKMEIQAMFHDSENPFSNLLTDYKREQALEQSTCYVKPIPYFMGDTLEGKFINQVYTLEPGMAMGKKVLIKEVLQKLFKTPSVLHSILSYMDSLSVDSENISNVIQGSLYKTICYKFPGKKILPVGVYFDEWEANVAIGAHAGVHKMGSVYISLLCVPPEFRSKLENIFLALLFLSSDFEEQGPQAAFRPLIQQFKELETEPVFKTEDGLEIYVCFLIFIADNLGVHQVTGLVKSFSANHPCRMCRVAKNEMQKQITEDESLLRTVEDYENDVELNDVKSTGISGRCIFKF